MHRPTTPSAPALRPGLACHRGHYCVRLGRRSEPNPARQTDRSEDGRRGTLNSAVQSGALGSRVCFPNLRALYLRQMRTISGNPTATDFGQIVEFRANPPSPSRPSLRASRPQPLPLVREGPSRALRESLSREPFERALREGLPRGWRSWLGRPRSHWIVLEYRTWRSAVS